MFLFLGKRLANTHADIRAAANATATADVGGGSDADTHYFYGTVPTHLLESNADHVRSLIHENRRTFCTVFCPFPFNVIIFLMHFCLCIP